MKNRSSLVLSIFLLSVAVQAQQPKIVFNRTYGGPESDISQMVRQMPDGGYLIGGTTSSFGDLNGDIYLLRTDADGEVLWEKAYGGPQRERVQWAMNNAMQLTSDGGIVVCGTTRSYGAGGLDYYLIKTDANGNLLWERTYGGTGDDYGRIVRETSDGGFIFVGLTFSFGVLANDVYIVKTDADGNVGPSYPGTWQATYNLNYWDTGQDIIETTDGYFVTGSALLFKIDKDGNPDNTFGTHDFQPGPAVTPIYDRGIGKFNILEPGGDSYAIEKTSDGGFILAGNRRAGVDDGYLIKLDALGNVVWKQVYPGPGANFAYAVQELNDGTYVVAGETNGMGAGGWDWWVFQTDDLGNQLWENAYGSSGSDWAMSVQATPDGGFLLTGLNNIAGTGGGQDLWLLKFLFVEDPACLTGNLFFDQNGNCNVNGNDQPLGNQMIKAQAGSNPPYFTSTDPNGDYKFVVETETAGVEYEISVVPDPVVSVWPGCDQSYTHTVYPTDIVPDNDFAAELTGADCMSSINIISVPFEAADCPGLTSLSSPCPDYHHKYEIIICNDLGQNDINLNSQSSIVITLPQGMSYITGSLQANCMAPNNPGLDFDEPLINQQTLSWDNNNMDGILAPSACCVLEFEVDVDPTAVGPFEIHGEFSAWCVGNNNQTPSVSEDHVIDQDDCSCDPNDKMALPKGCGPYGNIPRGQDVSYRVRFENTGTGPAHNIVVRDVLDDDFDLSTFALLRSSHTITHLQIENGNELVIRFEGIELPAAGKGEFLFNIEPKAGLPEGTTLTNSAAIYFDFNPPVITNTTLNTIREIPSPEAAFTATRACILNDIVYDFTYTGATPDAATFAWDFGPDASPSTSTERDPSGIVFSSMGPKEISLTVTRYGCAVTTTQIIEVPDIQCGNNSNRVLICHIPANNPSAARTLCIDPNAAESHLAHGDICGPCLENLQPLAYSSNSQFAYTEPNDFHLYPVPAREVIQLGLSNYLGKTVSITIYDYLGKRVLLLEKDKLQTPDLSIDLHQLRLSEGIYFVDVRSEGLRKLKRMIVAY